MTEWSDEGDSGLPSPTSPFEPRVFGDERGFFSKTSTTGLSTKRQVGTEFRADNHSRSIRGVSCAAPLPVAAQRPRASWSVVQGEVFDVAVDIRKGHRASGSGSGKSSAPKNRRQLWFPGFCLHGFPHPERVRRFPLQDHRLLFGSSSAAFSGMIRTPRSTALDRLRPFPAKRRGATAFRRRGTGLIRALLRVKRRFRLAGSAAPSFHSGTRRTETEGGQAISDGRKGTEDSGSESFKPGPEAASR